MYQSSQLDILLYLHRSENNETTKNRITYKNKTLTVSVKDENAHKSKGPAPTITNYTFDQCLPINDLRSATAHANHIVTLAVKGYSTTILLMNLSPSLVSRFIQQQLAFLNTSVALYNQKHASKESKPLKLEYCYINLTDKGCQNLLNKLPISNDNILTYGLDRYMTAFTNLSETSSLLSASGADMEPKLMALKITNDKSVDGYLYFLDLQQPYSPPTRPYPLSENFKSLVTTVGQLQSKYTEFGSCQANRVLDHLLIDLLVGRQQGLLILDIEETPQDDDIPQIESCLSFAKSISSIHGYTSRNVTFTWMVGAKIKEYIVENEKLDAKAHALEMENKEMKSKIKIMSTAMETMDRQHKELSEKRTTYIKDLEASTSKYKSLAYEMASQNSILQEKLANTEFALHSSNTKSQEKNTTIKKIEQQMAKQKSVLQEKVANTMSTLNFSDSKLFEKDQTIKKLEASLENKTHQVESGLLDRYKQQLENMERSYESRMEATSRQHMETRYLLQEQLTRSKDKCVLLEKELVNLKKKNQDSKGLEDDLKRYHDQWQNAQKMVDLHQRTIQHLSSTIDENNRTYEDQERILQQKLSDGKRQLAELRERYLDDYLRVHQEFEAYANSSQLDLEDRELQLERQGDDIEHYRANATDQQEIIRQLETKIREYQQTIQHLQTDDGRNRQETQKLQTENHEQQQIIQKLQVENDAYPETIQQLQMENHGYEQYIQKLQMDSRGHQEHIQELDEEKENLMERVEKLETEASHHQTYVITLQEMIQAEKKTAHESEILVEQLKATIKKEEAWSRKQVKDINKERAMLLQWIGLARLKWNEASAGTATAATTKPIADQPTVLTTVFPESTLPSTLCHKVPIYVFPFNPHQKRSDL